MKRRGSARAAARSQDPLAAFKVELFQKAIRRLMEIDAMQLLSGADI